ncbi:MAG TPA: hypothetical protein VFF67_01515 [Thermoplasmata archaeon]|nr:hypothetical protein [Thermoplasmata archaeon]
MQKPPAQRATPDRFLGVRMSLEELRLLDAYAERERSRSRSDAVRSLVRAAGESRPDAVELPLQVRAELATIVEDGWARDTDAALAAVYQLGLEAFAELHAKRFKRLRRTARENFDRVEGRRRAEREGGGYLGR